jgi:DivIVA domain-containing protein
MANEENNAPSDPRITPADIQRQEFGVSRFGGYRMRDVDEFLDRLTESTELIIAENERLRSSGGPIVGSADLSEIDRQADEILQRARDEAKRIVEQARGGDAGASIAPVDDEQRVAVDAFLSQERAFLQSLATLVQGHAESVKAMAKQARRTPAAETVQPEEEAPSERAEADISLPEASAEEPTERGEGDASPATGDETVVLDVPEPSPLATERQREGDPSLKQLFWGEER